MPFNRETVAKQCTTFSDWTLMAWGFLLVGGVTLDMCHPVASCHVQNRPIRSFKNCQYCNLRDPAAWQGSHWNMVASRWRGRGCKVNENILMIYFMFSPLCSSLVVDGGLWLWLIDVCLTGFSPSRSTFLPFPKTLHCSSPGNLPGEFNWEFLLCDFTDLPSISVTNLHHCPALPCVFSVRRHYRYTLHWRNTQPHQLRLLHQLPVIRRHHRRPAVPPLEETQLVPTHQGTDPVEPSTLFQGQCGMVVL